jgi:hypothetical protein
MFGNKNTVLHVFALDLSSCSSMARLRTATAAVNYNDIMCI